MNIKDIIFYILVIVDVIAIGFYLQLFYNEYKSNFLKKDSK